MGTCTRFIPIIGVLALCAFTGCQKNSSLDTAHKAENAGDCKTALPLYITAFQKATTAVALPNRNTAEVIDVQAWAGKIGGYIEAALAPVDSVTAQAREAFEGIVRCQPSVPAKNYLTAPHIKKPTPDSFVIALESQFALTQAPDTVLTGQLRAAGASIVTISSGSTYIYQGSIIEKSTLKRTDYLLYPENQISFIARPGEYLVTCQGQFQATLDEIWKSPVEALLLTVKEPATLVTCLVRTKVKRNEE
jgi:hypothetical protein